MNIDKEREAFEALFEEKLGAHNSQFDLDSDGNYEDRETLCAWHMYLAGLNKKLEGCVVVPEAEFALLPKTITPEVEEILGMPCFKFIKAAQIYRQLGFNIPPKAEKEQSFFMFKFLHLALVHGDKCFDVFESETKAMVEAARSGNEVQQHE
ncbi:hypothetical protein [Acinetobacter colistiniresistens]|uniref:hypothetical protein n=1 Tax=Acinetobacter colistiniresistens TaxID=280145 RepID=UPI00208E8935|nr:hypothetical protein [Acinetobacter colistiniresistens]